MFKNGALLLLLLPFLIKDRCYAMRMAAQQDAPKKSQSIQGLNETAANEFIQQLRGKKYADMASEVSKLSDEQRECVKSILDKNHSPFKPQVRLQQVLAGHTAGVISTAFSPNGRFILTGANDKFRLFGT